MSIITNIKSNYGKYLAKAAGTVALGLIGYDAHNIGKLQSDVCAQSRDANVCMDLYENSQRLDTPSTIKGKMKEKVFKYELGSNILGFFNSGIGYFSGFGSMLVNNVVPLGLGLTALIAKNKKLACGSGIGLALYGAYSFIKDGFGVGTSKFLQK